MHDHDNVRKRFMYDVVIRPTTQSAPSGEAHSTETSTFVAEDGEREIYIYLSGGFTIHGIAI